MIPHHQNKTKQINLDETRYMVITTVEHQLFAYLRRTLLVRIVTEILELRVDLRQAEISKLCIQSSLRHLSHGNLHEIRSTRGQMTTILLDLERVHIPDYSLEMTQHRAHPIRHPSPDSTTQARLARRRSSPSSPDH